MFCFVYVCFAFFYLFHHVQFKPWLGKNQFWKLFEQNCLLLSIRFVSIGKPPKVFLFFNFQHIFVLVQWPPSWCWCTTFITVWHHLSMLRVGQGMYGLTVDHSMRLPGSISTCFVKRPLLQHAPSFFLIFALLLHFFISPPFEDILYCSPHPKSTTFNQHTNLL